MQPCWTWPTYGPASPRSPADGEVVLLDPIGGPIAVALAEELGERAILVTQDLIAGNELSRTGDLAPANVRLQQRGVRIERRSVVRAVRRAAEGLDGLEVDIDDRFTGRRRTIACAAVVDCGFRLPDDPLPGAFARAGDCVAPRTILEAVLEGRRSPTRCDNRRAVRAGCAGLQDYNRGTHRDGGFERHDLHAS